MVVRRYADRARRRRRIARQRTVRVDRGARALERCGRQNGVSLDPVWCLGASDRSRASSAIAAVSSPGDNFHSRRDTSPSCRLTRRCRSAPARPRRSQRACVRGGRSASRQSCSLHARSRVQPTPTPTGTATRTKGGPTASSASGAILHSGGDMVARLWSLR